MLFPLYTALGNRIHLEKQPISRELVEAAVAEVGLDPVLVDAMDDESYDDAVAASHHEGMDQVGDDVGHPDHRLRGRRLLRPGAEPDPPRRGRRATCGTAASPSSKVPYFYELKRSRTGELDFS